jgi:adenine phosphoribosyltransferase
MDIEFLKSKLVAIPDFPKPGILFQDIFPLFTDPVATETLVTNIVHHITSSGTAVDAIVGLDSRGFLLGPWIANRLKVAFVPVRKAGKLPGQNLKVGYEKEYGTDYFEMSINSIAPNSNVVVIDDLIATGGSAMAAAKLIKLAGARVSKFVFFVELLELKGRDVLPAETYSVIKI